MANFSYIAATKSGKLKRGTISSSSSEQVKKILANKGLDLISCQEEEKTSLLNLSTKELFYLIFKRKISVLEKMSFSHHLAVMLRAGVPIIEAVEVLSTDVVNPKFRKILKKLRSDLEAGKNLSSFFKDKNFFSKSHLSMLKAGESSGKVEEALRRISNDLEKDYKIIRKVKGAMSYPLIIILALTLISGFIITFVLPKVGDVFIQMNIKIPIQTKILLAIGAFMNKNYVLVGAGLVSLIAGAIFIFKFTNLGSKLAVELIGRLPGIKTLAIKINMARFVRSLSSLLMSGVPFAQSVEIAGSVFLNKHYKEIIGEAVEKIEKGVSLTSVLRSNKKYFDSMFIKMCSVGEKTGKLAEILKEVASFYENEVDDKLENMATIIEPVLMLLVGFGVGAMILTIIGPIYQMIGSLNQ